MPLKLIKHPNSKNYVIRGTLFGVYVYESTGIDRKEIAEALRVNREAQIINDHVYGAKARVTFAEAAASYLETGGSLRFVGRIGEDGTKEGLVGYFQHRLLHKIKQKDLDDAAAKLYPNAQPETRNRQCYTPFIAVWNHAVGNEWAETRQWKRPRKAKGTNVARRVLRSGTHPVSYDHAATFVAAMSPAPAMVMTALFFTGMRPIELFALEARNVNVDGRWITLTSTKTGEPRGVPMHEFLVPLFTALLARDGMEPTDKVFRTPRGEAYAQDETGVGGIAGAIKGARRRTEIKDMSPYTGRHSVSTQLVINGVHPHIKDQILGHATDDMSRHYTNVPQAPLIAAINTIQAPKAWAELPWWEDPLKWESRLAEGTGKRTDLEKKRG